MGFTLLESQSCGTPVICTDAGAMHEFLDQGKTGLVVGQNSGAAITSALGKLIDSSPAQIEEYQTYCQHWIQSLSWKNVVQSHLKVYQQ